MNINLFGYGFLLILGILFLILKKALAERTVRYINKQPKWMRWGVKANVVSYRIMCIVAGILFVIVSLRLLIDEFP